MDKIEIHGYKSIKDLVLPFRPINILIGSNGSGKSNFLSFFEFLSQIYRRNLQSHVALKGLETFLHKGDKVTKEISAGVSYSKEFCHTFTLRKGDDHFVFTKEKWGNDAKQVDLTLPNQIESNPDLLFQEGSSLTYFTFRKNATNYHFNDTGANSPFNQGANIDAEFPFLYEDGRNIAAYLFHIREEHPRTYRFIVSTIQSIAPYFLDFYLEPNNNGLMKLLWQSRYASTVYSINDFSDGTIRFIALAALFLQPELPRTLIVDEPELGLHPAAIAKLSGLIQSAATRKCQVIIATQSPDLISYFQPEDIITVDQKEGASIFKRLSKEELEVWLEDYTMGDLWKQNIIAAGQP